MNNYFESYQLILLSEEYLRELYNWNIAEKHFEQYTCRPLKLQKSYGEYVNKMMDSIDNIKDKTYILVKEDNSVPLGKIELFDYNPRNHSAEFGYYLPEHNRNKGIGSIILEQFINIAFTDNDYNLNKLYATTSSNNISSIKLLEKYGFKIDGRLREHYWINESKYDQCVYSILKSEL
ncbi:GNAT family N-acetyltransferase [Clostridium estertheticum]|uniref:GNAT family N-acetyltransferase n=1 Tax=Clostridium estertheticum TaxID=238834 RepID=UPI0013EE6F8A|nr:GNAT family protein [Clostridium estertheticum]MBZ9609402.1 GNAT family N-acetyltransferase [Clostridium estertheticum]